jgi:hypothetical protein
MGSSVCGIRRSQVKEKRDMEDSNMNGGLGRRSERRRRRLGAAPVLLGRRAKRHCVRYKHTKGGKRCAAYAAGGLGRRSKRKHRR